MNGVLFNSCRVRICVILFRAYGDLDGICCHVELACECNNIILFNFLKANDEFVAQTRPP